MIITIALTIAMLVACAVGMLGPEPRPRAWAFAVILGCALFLLIATTMRFRLP